MKKLLDIGCGPGGFINFSYYKKLEKIYTIHGVDFLEENIKLIKKNYPKGTFHVGNAEKLPFPAKSFDAILARHILEHAHNVRKVLGEIKRVCKKDAEIFIAVPHPRFESIMTKFIPHYMREGFHHERVIDKKILIRLLTEEEFTIKKVTNDKWPIFILDLLLGFFARIGARIEMQSQTGIFTIGEKNYTKNKKDSSLYQVAYDLMDIINKVFPFMNRIIPFEIEVYARYEKKN